MATSLTWLKKNDIFNSSMRKMSTNIPLENDELEFSLACAVLFLKEYSNDKRQTPYFEIAYYIVLKCAINNNEYEPLLDVSSNFGLYPISKYITKNQLHSIGGSAEFTLSYQLEKYFHNEITETYEQKKFREILVHSKKEENCYIAPTSFGKSSLIIEIIKSKKLSKVSIVVPTKSLLIQTYKLIRNNFPEKNIIFHDEMYDGTNDFIAVFTQERALRLLKNDDISFDLLIIDEAHNLFNNDSRSVLLTRLIRRNRKRNPKSINYYLSPLISDSNNLKVEGSQDIFERKIISNIKEADIYEYKINGEIKKYNRFIDEFFHLGESNNFIDYIIKYKKHKNFLYLRAPKRVEELAVILDSKLKTSKSKKLHELSDVISKNVHKDFYCVDYIKKGLVYLHGKLPDLIKEYLEFKFSESKEIEYVIANSVILEGVNLPVDNMYILNTNSLDEKSLINLIGRVNRLNEVFDDSRKSLDKLTPSIHFVNSDEFNRKGGNMENQIKKLKSGIFKDSVDNPLLVNFDLSKLKSDIEKAMNTGDLEKQTSLENKLKRYREVNNREDFLIYNDLESDSKIKRILLESNVLSVYFNSENILIKISNKIQSMLSKSDWKGLHVIDKVYLFFINEFEQYITEPEFLRLQHESARSFYKMFTNNIHRLSLKEHISTTISYFQSIKNKPQGREFYIGTSYGEFAKHGLINSTGKNVYLDLSSKSNKEIANIAMIKIKIENDFISYTLNNYVNVLFDLGMISENEYELYIYGTTNKSNSDFVKLGISGSLINKLSNDKQIGNLSINEYGIIEYNKDFLDYLIKQDDLVQFEVGKFIDM